ncbi:MAG: hypothetical protein CMD53_01710 [Gammaproteobacteria bacterium]|nr:hypothetical protein [Gammaproteobacteria bacterium]|tara:strand:- start:8747 stop:9475 length:729 start_codon:yes stop_codon:yes gene_type:complete
MVMKPEQLHLNVQLDDVISLDRFINCESTKECLKILKKSVEDDSISNFYFIWGNKGVGKSYLMKGLHREFINKEMKTFHFSFEDERVSGPEILQNLESMDAIIIEDFESMISSEEWEVAVFNLINACFLSKTKIYISSKTVSKDLEIDLVDLMSRLSSFTGVEVPEISEEEKIEALKQSATRKGIELEERAIKYIINYTSRNLSDLLKLINELDSFSLQMKKKITPVLIKKLLDSRLSSPHT